MKHVSSEKSSLAWFKLAEFVTRGEKERALSIYRLLAHSIKSEALAAQLEGDLLQAFDDDRALEAYRRAALLYLRENDIVQAILLYEQISTSAPQRDDILQILLGWYQRLDDQQRCIDVAQRLITLFVLQNRFTETHEMIVQLILNEKNKLKLHEQFVLALLTSPLGKNEDRLIKTHTTLILDYFLCTDQQDTAQENITRFLATLAGLDTNIHCYACDYAKNAQTDGTCSIA